MTDDLALARAERLLAKSAGDRISVEKTPCPMCGSKFSKVVRSQGTKRQRQCDGCKGKYTTVERTEAA